MISSISLVTATLQEKPEVYKLSREEINELKDEQNIEVAEVQEDSDLENFALEKGDTPLLLCRSSDLGQLDLVVYNAGTQDLFLHHTVDLPFLPLNAVCTSFEPFSCTNVPYSIVSGMATYTELYKTNCLDQFHPDYTLSELIRIKDSDKELPDPKGPQNHILCAACDHRYPNIYVCGSLDGALYFYDLSSCTTVRRLHDVHNGGVNNLQIAGQRFVTSGIEDQALKMWDFELDCEKPITTIQLGHNIEQLCLLEHEQHMLIFVSTEDGLLFVVRWDGQIVTQRQVWKSPITGLSVQHSRQVIAACSPEEESIELLDFDLKPVGTIKVDAQLLCLQFSQSDVLFAGSDDGKLFVFNYIKRLAGYETHESKERDQKLDIEHGQFDDDED